MNLTTETTKSAASRAGDEILLKRAKEGDNRALSEIYEQTYEEVYRTIRSLIRNEDDAFDVLQDSYLKALTRLDQLSSGAQLRPWLRQIAANTAKDWLRRKKPALFSELQPDKDTPFDIEDDREEALPEVQLDRQETQRVMNEVLRSVSDAQQLVLGMFYYEGLSVKEIAAQTGVAQGTVKSQLRYGRQKIEKRLRELEKQGVSFGGAAPIAFFRALLQKNLAELPTPSALDALKQALAEKGVSALEPAASGMKVKAITAKSLLLKRVLIGAGALAAAGGIAVGAGLLANRSREMGDVRPESAEEPESVVEVVQSGTPVETGTPEEIELRDYEPWQKAYLDLLAGVATPSQQEGYNGFFAMAPYSIFENALLNGGEDRFWYLGDFDGDGTPELMMPYGLADDNNLTLYGLAEDGVYEYLGSFHNVGWTDVHGTLLYSEANGYMNYNVGACIFRVEYVGSDENGRWVFEDGLPGWSGADYRDLPRYGALSVEAEAQHPVLFEVYRSRLAYLEHLTLTDTGDEYFIVDYEYVTEEEYRAAEQTILDAADFRCIDETLAPQFMDLPLAQIAGPLTCEELVDQLGGYDGRSEWTETRRLVEAGGSYGKIFSGLLSDPDRLTDALRAQYPDEAIGAGSWEFAVVRLEDSATLAVCYRQTAQEGDSIFLSDLRCRDVLEGSLSFYRVRSAGEVELWCSHNGCPFVVRRAAQTHLGTRWALFSLTLERYPDDISDGEVTTESLFRGIGALQQIRFVPAQTLLERFTADHHAQELDLGDPVDVEVLRGSDQDGTELACLLPLLENPELLMYGDWWVYDDEWYQTDEITWEVAVPVVDGVDAPTQVVLRGRRQGEVCEEWMVFTLEEQRGSLSATADGPYQNIALEFYYASTGDLNEPAPTEEDGGLAVWRLFQPDENSYIYRCGWRSDDPENPYVDAQGWLFSDEEMASAQRVTFRPLADVLDMLVYGPLEADPGQTES